MRLRVKPNRRRMDRVVLNLAAMIDVTFLLLMYFMVATVLEDQESRLSAMLASDAASAEGGQGDFQPQNVEVKMVEGVPSYTLGARVFHKRDDLTAALDRLPTSAGVYVRVGNDVPVGFAVAAVQAAHDAGFVQVTYVPAK